MRLIQLLPMMPTIFLKRRPVWLLFLVMGWLFAQAQHAVKELQTILEANGVEVVYAIHPVAGRMPGHMNVLLAEADVPYDLLLEMDQVNPRLEMFDVALVIGANDVVNPRGARG